MLYYFDCFARRLRAFTYGETNISEPFNLNVLASM